MPTLYPQDRANHHGYGSWAAAAGVAMAIALAGAPARADDSKPGAACTNCWDGSQGMHFLASGVAGVIASDVLKDRPKWQQFAASQIPGVLKELGDGKVSGKDVFANMLGGLVGIYVGPLMVQKSRDAVTVSVVLQW